MEKETKNSVLIVDDEGSAITALTHILSPEYSIYVATNRPSAVEAAEKHLPDVILLDIVLPEMDGFAVITAIKHSEKTRNIPVIFVTGLNDTGDEEKGLAYGAADYIAKPFSPTIVKLRVQNQIKALQQARLILGKELEEKSNRARIDFLSRMSHEMLTPMNTIMGLTHVLKITGTSNKSKEYLDEIDTAAHHLLELINNLLEVSCNKDGTLVLANSAFSFSTVLQDVFIKIDWNVKKKEQWLTTDIDPSVPTRLIGDKERLSQVIVNLLVNAAKFTPERGKIHLSAKVLDENNENITLKIAVTDNGDGIPKDKQAEIFSIFNQTDEGTTRQQEGIGLGLPISKRNVEMMDGEIWVDSEIGKGSTFAFTCKLQRG
jgi:signal transduction histidine kinase